MNNKNGNKNFKNIVLLLLIVIGMVVFIYSWSGLTSTASRGTDLVNILQNKDVKNEP